MQLNKYVVEPHCLLFVYPPLKKHCPVVGNSWTVTMIYTSYIRNTYLFFLTTWIEARAAYIISYVRHPYNIYGYIYIYYNAA